MAEEFVRKEHFEQFALRIDERFLSIEKRMEQGFAHAAKERENILAHLDQRFEGVNQRFEGVNQRFDSLENNLGKRLDDMRTLIVVMYTPVAIAVLGGVVKWFFFSN